MTAPILRQVEPDRDNLQHYRPPSWILADPPWNKDAVGGRSHHQRPSTHDNAMQLKPLTAMSNES
jgi:hypothetical protein